MGETGSGAQDCPGLTELLGRLEEGDRLSVWKLDRLGRSLSQLTVDIENLGKRGVQFRSLTEQLDTTSPYAGSSSPCTPPLPRLSGN